MQWGPLSGMSGKALLPPPLALFLPTPRAVASAAGMAPAAPRHSKPLLLAWISSLARASGSPPVAAFAVHLPQVGHLPDPVQNTCGCFVLYFGGVGVAVLRQAVANWCAVRVGSS